MYIPGYYKNTDLEEVKKFVQANSFGLLITWGSSRPEATHIPIELAADKEGADVLQGHISRGNAQRKAIRNGSDVLAVFSGPHAYVSSSWYDHENVPTWNYMAVHIYGKLRLLEEEELYLSLKRLVDKHEQASENPLRLETLNEDLVKEGMRGIVGFEIAIGETQVAYKLSQDKDDKNHQAIAGQLRKRGGIHDHAVAGQMDKVRSDK